MLNFFISETNSSEWNSNIAGNHKNIFNDAKVPWSEYRYYDPKTVGLDFDGMISDIKVMTIQLYFSFLRCQMWTYLSSHVSERGTVHVQSSSLIFQYSYPSICYSVYHPLLADLLWLMKLNLVYCELLVMELSRYKTLSPQVKKTLLNMHLQSYLSFQMFSLFISIYVLFRNRILIMPALVITLYDIVYFINSCILKTLTGAMSAWHIAQRRNLHLQLNQMHYW